MQTVSVKAKHYIFSPPPEESHPTNTYEPLDDLNDRPSGEMSMLLVEDNANHAALVRRFLEESEFSFNTVHADSVSNALKCLKQLRCHVIVTDLFLPDAVGIEAVELICEAAPSVPVIVLSGNTDRHLAVKAVQAGAEDYLLKDEISERSLARAIRYAIERQQNREELSRLAHYDDLTGLLNRSSFTEHLKQSIRRAKRQSGCVGLMFLDLDGFKEINDHHGHRTGDRLLTVIGSRLQKSVRESDVVARLGGDEFGVLLENIVETEEVCNVARRILEEINAPTRIDGQDLDISGSIGVALAEDINDTAEQLTQKADVAMYQAKAAGRNQFCFFDHHLYMKQRLRKQSERELRIAIEEDAFEVFYQPQYCIHSGAIIGAEALLRWRHATRGIVGPTEFIPILEEQKLIYQVGESVIRKVCSFIKENEKKSHSHSFAINVFPLQLEDRNFANTVKNICLENQIDSSRLQFEITEHMVISDSEQVRRTLFDLQSIGVRLAIDDFGTGYSSLAYLRRFPVNQLKIDRMFVSGSNDVDRPIVSTVVNLGHGLNCQVLAEGVETQEQLQALKELGCDSFQGFLKSKAVPADELRAKLSENT